ncbi:MFS transporter [Rhodococcus sp. KBS0724]|uniref:MFS transporter n=1 Tax=Rhodococcus sp. KBS0724 TaxID=1179674 RepID=UPI00110E4FF3|nr:MFS transporter [Rhodococcus sp. KBS0724]TSD45644.1 MFS transporter [Rhodococcus sp. KBS0724]
MSMSVEISAGTEVGAASYRRGTAGYRAVTLALFAAGLTTFVSMYSAQALLPAFSHAFGVSPAVSALSVSVTTGMVALAIIPASALSERFGRTRVMIFSAITSCVIGLLLPLSPTIEILLVGRAFQGAALAGIPAVAMAYLAEEIDPKDLGGAMGRYVAGTTVGGLIGRLIPAAVVDVSSWHWALFAVALLSTVFAIVMTRALPRSQFFRPQPVSARRLVSNLRAHLAHSEMRTLFALGFIMMGAFVSVYNFLGFRLAAVPFGLSEAIVGLVFLFYLAGTVTSTVAGALADRVGQRWVLLGSVSVTVLGLVLTVPDNLVLTLVGILLFTGGFFAAHSVASGWVGRLARAHRAEASALYLFAYYAGSSVAGVLAGSAYAVGGWNGVSVFVACLLVVAMGLSLRMFRATRVG